MNTERDPFLESMFVDAAQTAPSDALADEVATRVAKQRRRLVFGRIAIVAALVLLEVALESPLSRSFGVIADTMGASILPLSEGWASYVLGPINSVAGVVGIALVGAHALIRRVIY